MRDAPAIAVIAVAVVLVARPWVARHRRRHIRVTIELIEGAKEPPPPSSEGDGDGGSGDD